MAFSPAGLPPTVTFPCDAAPEAGGPDAIRLDLSSHTELFIETTMRGMKTLIILYPDKVADFRDTLTAWLDMPR
jgi:hypothetical protein